MRRTRRNACSYHAQRGVGLIEVLIAVLVLSFGMLGLAGLQMWMLRNNQSSHERAMAIVQTHSIVDAMRADRATATNNGFDLALDADAPSGSSFAAISLSAWRANLQAVLGPGAAGEVDCDGALCTVVVRWNDARGTDGSEAQTVTTEVQL